VFCGEPSWFSFASEGCRDRSLKKDSSGESPSAEFGMFENECAGRELEVGYGA
jgi:hypothetical protein